MKFLRTCRECGQGGTNKGMSSKESLVLSLKETTEDRSFLHDRRSFVLYQNQMAKPLMGKYLRFF